jgi:2-polyprenyl-3-methyl-5-hydroxy-6-metoxy-1,4-benzoquinol methylase
MRVTTIAANAISIAREVLSTGPRFYNPRHMPIGYLRAFRLLRQTFRRHSAPQQLHVFGRFLSAPFLRTLDVIPPGSRVLDVGAGHGIYARLLVEERAREVVAVEPDLRKTLIAWRHPAVRFVAGFDDCVRDTFDVVTIYDVLYRLDAAARDALLPRLFARLRPGGLLVLKEIDPTSRIKEPWNRAQEFLSDTLFGLSLGNVFYNETPDVIAERLTRAGFVDFTAKRIDFGYPHAHILYTARRPD